MAQRGRATQQTQMDKLGSFHANQTSELRKRLRPDACLSPSIKYFYWHIQGGTSFVDHLCYLCLVTVIILRLFIVV